LKLNSENANNTPANNNNTNNDKKADSVNWMHVGGAAAVGAGLAVGGLFAAGKIGGTPKA
jgi:hypothetical protein